MNAKRIERVIGFVIALSLLITPLALAEGPASPATDTPAGVQADVSHRLIVELQSPSVAAKYATQGMTGELNLASAEVSAYRAQLRAEQAAFLSAMQAALPSASVSSYINEFGEAELTTYEYVLNGMAIEPGVSVDAARRVLGKMDMVKSVYLDYAHYPSLYTSTTTINAPVVWDDTEIGGRDLAGAGIKVASMDGGLHKDAPMFSGEGFDYPDGYPEDGLGLTQNNNGKIIASRVYFRTWDPPKPGEQNPWPGLYGTSHGCHTGSIAAGNTVDASYLGMDIPQMSGVAPGAWVMSYRVFYQSVTDDGSFYTAEGVAALEDIFADDADVLNNSWGGGPGSVGGEFDALDTALTNLWAAGTFVSMSAGNAGPGNGTTDHPSDGYIVVAATSTEGTLASGSVNVTEPAPVPDELLGASFSGADFGANLPLGEVMAYPYRTSASVDPGNVTGCSPFADGVFEGYAAVISRGDCYFSDKARNAQMAGATFVIIYNNEGDDLINMACGDVCDDITIPAIFVGQTYGDALVAWYETNGDDSVFEIDTTAFQAGNEPDVVASFSSRGPGAGAVLKPDIAAPGVSILAQGYAPGVVGEARHLGWGQASGTSMASPHVAGAAALLKQLHPEWGNGMIKSAMMSTAVYMDVYNHDGTVAQPLDIGAGRLDVAAAADAAAMICPPSASLGDVFTGTTKTMEIQVTNITDAAETYAISTLDVGGGFTATTELTGVTVEPVTTTIEAGETAIVTVTLDTEATAGIGDVQGYILLDGEASDAHLPVWACVLPCPAEADVLIIDNDGSTTLGMPDYTAYYTTTLENLDVSYDVWDADAYFGHATTVPDAAVLQSYDAIIYFTGDNYYPDGYFTVTTPLSEKDTNLLTQYLNAGGALIAMGQDLTAVVNSTDPDNALFFYEANLGGKYIQDSVTGFDYADQRIGTMAGAPSAFEGLVVDVSDAEEGDGAWNQLFIDEIEMLPVKAPDNSVEEVPYTPFLQYSGPYVQDAGTVGMLHRDQPTLERPGVTYDGRTVFTTFGLEGVNNLGDSHWREDLIALFLDYVWDDPEVTISDITPPGVGEMVILEAEMESGGVPIDVETLRWDFGDGSAFTPAYESDMASYVYASPGVYTVKVEAMDVLGNKVIGEAEINTDKVYVEPLFLPFVARPDSGLPEMNRGN